MRRLPSLGARAWRSAPLLPWRVQCPGRVCAALAAGSGGSGQFLVSCLPRFPLSRPACSALCVAGRPVRVSLTLARWYAIPCGLCVPLTRSACSSGNPRVTFVCVCALVLPRRPLPPPHPPAVGVARAPRAVPVLGAGRAVQRGTCPSACPAPFPCSVWLAWGGIGPVPFPPYPAWGCALPTGWVCAPGASLRRGVGWGGGAACAPCLPTVRPGGPVGRGSPCLVPSLWSRGA